MQLQQPAEQPSHGDAGQNGQYQWLEKEAGRLAQQRLPLFTFTDSQAGEHPVSALVLRQSRHNFQRQNRHDHEQKHNADVKGADDEDGKSDDGYVGDTDEFPL